MRLVLILFIGGMASLANCHPHEWINYIVKPEINDKGEITALNEQWVFDPLAAQMMLEPVLSAPNNQEQEKQMKALQKSVNDSLAEQQYFTFSQSQPFAQGENPTLSVRDGILHYHIRLPLKKPSKTIQYSIYEPSYYIEMRYDEDKQIMQFDHGCQLNIQESNPSEDMIATAYAIDIKGKGDTQLGKYFAQQSQLSCP